MERSELILKLAEIIHKSWAFTYFDPKIDQEDVDAAEAILVEFPQLLTTEAADAAS